MKRVLITGASGFIGRHALQFLLNHGFEVHAAVNRSAVADPSVAWHRANLLDAVETRELLAAVRPTHLLHFAWIATPGEYRKSQENFRWCQAGIELLAAFAACGGSRAVFAGSCFEYDLPNASCREDCSPCRPRNRYGACKLALSEIVTHCPPDGVSTAWGRIFYVYGPHEAPGRLVPSIITSLLRSERASCTHGQQLRDFLHVDDVASAFVALLDSDVEGPVNVASGKPTTIRALVERIAHLADGDGRIDFGAVAPTEFDPPAVVADVHKLREVLGWGPKRGLDEALVDTIQWWRDRL